MGGKALVHLAVRTSFELSQVSMRMAVEGNPWLAVRALQHVLR